MCTAAVRVVRVMQRRCICTVVQYPCVSKVCIKNAEPLTYCGDSCERLMLTRNLDYNSFYIENIPIVIGDEFICEGQVQNQIMPHDHQRVIADYSHATENTIEHAIDIALSTRWYWERVPMSQRICIWQTAACLAANEWRLLLNSATMLGQSKTVIQAELDTCELIDSLNYSAFFVNEHLKYQPESPCPEVECNSIHIRGVDGFVAAMSPFNSTAVACDLATIPALMGNCVVWRPDESALLSSWLVYNILRAAGLPGGVINFVPSDLKVFKKVITSSKSLGGINYCGPVQTFNSLWKSVATNINKYSCYPRLVGETGGNSYHFVHCSADVETVVACTIRAAFEFSGQKSSSCTRLYVPLSLEDCIVKLLISEQRKLKVGDPRDYSVFTGAVINKHQYERLKSIIKKVEYNKRNKILVGGRCSDKCGYYIEPTIIQTIDLDDCLMTEQICGPILTIYAYDDNMSYQLMSHIVATSKYALAASIFGKDCCWLSLALDTLKNTAGNFYINDKSTGSVVGKQPYGGSRHSGTNDKTGGPHYMMRWCSPQTVKEKYSFDKHIIYPYMTQNRK